MFCRGDRRKSGDKPTVTFAEEKLPDIHISQGEGITKRPSSPRLSSPTLLRSSSGPAPTLDREVSKGEGDSSQLRKIHRSLSSDGKSAQKYPSEGSQSSQHSDHRKSTDSEGMKKSSDSTNSKTADSRGVKSEYDADGVAVLKRAVNEVGNYIVVAGTKEALVNALTTDKACTRSPHAGLLIYNFSDVSRTVFSSSYAHSLAHICVKQRSQWRFLMERSMRRMWIATSHRSSS